MTRDITPAGSPATGAVDEAFAEVRASFDRFCLAAGIKALGTMMEADVTAACGPRHGRDAARRAHRWGRTQGRIGFGAGTPVWLPSRSFPTEVREVYRACSQR
jgi:hypothetical protein